MHSAFSRFRVAVALVLVLAFALPPKGFAEATSRPTVSPAAALGLEVGRPIEFDLPDGSRIRGIVFEVSDSAAVIEYQSSHGVAERQTIAFSAMQAIPIPPKVEAKVDSWLDKYKWIVLPVAAVMVTVMFLWAAGQR